MSVLRRTLLVFSAAAIGVAVQTIPASATADNCGTNGDSGVYNCMYVAGGGLYASEVRGWSEYDAFGYPVHEEVTGPNGLVCNSPTSTPSLPNTVVGCQIYPNKNIAGGTYCSILWEYQNGEYYNDAENCVSVFA